nr:hypothetical protein [uncultured Ruminococcus sp.]
MNKDDKDGKNKTPMSTYIVIVVIFILIAIYVFACDNDTGKSEYDKLPKDQQEWIQRNYGNGQYDDIKDAMNDYNSNH